MAQRPPRHTPGSEARPRHRSGSVIGALRLPGAALLDHRERHSENQSRGDEWIACPSSPGRRASDAIGPAEVSRATVGIDEELVEGVRPPSLLLGDALGLVEPSVARRTRTVTTIATPSVEFPRRRTPGIEARIEVDEVDVVIFVTAEVLAPEA
jgi:hypothetical protein